MAIESYAYAIVLLYAIVVIIISVWNLFAFDKNNESETIFFILNIIAIILSVGIIIWVLILLFGSSGVQKSNFVQFRPTSKYDPERQAYLERSGFGEVSRFGAGPPPSDAPPPFPSSFAPRQLPTPPSSFTPRQLPTPPSSFTPSPQITINPNYVPRYTNTPSVAEQQRGIGF